MLGNSVHYVVDTPDGPACRVGVVVGGEPGTLDLDVFPNFGIDASVFPEELTPVGSVHGLIWRGKVANASDGAGTYHSRMGCPRQA